MRVLHRPALPRGDSQGETAERLDAWREAPVYAPREWAALGWSEAVTLVSQTHVPDDVYDEARKHFGEAELVNLTLAAVAINGWNQFAIGFRAQPTLGPKQSTRKARFYPPPTALPTSGTRERPVRARTAPAAVTVHRPVLL